MRGLKNLRHPDWEVLRDLWVEHLPDIDFSLQFPEPTLWDLPEIKERLINPAINTELPYIEGARESVFREVVVLTRKFSYCRMVGLDAAARGFPTWSVIAGYDACFYGAKAFCYFLGIVSVDRYSKLFIDLFHPRPNKIGKVRGQVYDVLVAHQFDRHLTRGTLWALTGRLCRTVSLPADARPLLEGLRSLNFEGMSTFRNKVMYDGGFWMNWDNLVKCDLTNVINDEDILRALRSPPDNPRDTERYFAVSSTIHEALVYFFADIAKLAPSIGAEVTALTNWRDQRT